MTTIIFISIVSVVFALIGIGFVSKNKTYIGTAFFGLAYVGVLCIVYVCHNAYMFADSFVSHL